MELSCNPDTRPDIHDVNRCLVEVCEVSLRYGNTLALDTVSFQLEQGQRVAVVGPNGAGKSSLFNIIAGMLPPTSGKVSFYGHDPSQHLCISYVPQRSQVDWQFPVTVADVVMMGRVGLQGLFRWSRRFDHEAVRAALATVEMDHLAKRQIGELSGGQQQRVFIARALAQEARLMLMDEPINGLDVTAQESMFALLDRLRERGVTLLVSTHDLNVATEHFDRLLLLNRRLVAFGRAEQVFTPELLTRTYGGQLQLIKTNQGTLALHNAAHN